MRKPEELPSGLRLLFYVQHERSMRRSLPGFAEGAIASHVRFTPKADIRHHEWHVR
jgi:hypothetical protein